jgi:hypothetical protein
MEVLERGKKLICVENAGVHGGHQYDLLSILAQEKHLLWCRTPSELSTALNQVKGTEFRRYVSPKSEIHIVIADFLQKLKGTSKPNH